MEKLSVELAWEKFEDFYKLGRDQEARRQEKPSRQRHGGSAVWLQGQEETSLTGAGFL